MAKTATDAVLPDPLIRISITVSENAVLRDRTAPAARKAIPAAPVRKAISGIAALRARRDPWDLRVPEDPEARREIRVKKAIPAAPAR